MTDRDKIVQHYCDKIKSPQTAIRAFCVQYMGGHVNYVTSCPSEKTCPLWPFRMGKNPFHKGRTDRSGVLAKSAESETKRANSVE